MDNIVMFHFENFKTAARSDGAGLSIVERLHIWTTLDC
jgi:hypothetical protein